MRIANGFQKPNGLFINFKWNKQLKVNIFCLFGVKIVLIYGVLDEKPIYVGGFTVVLMFYGVER